MEAQPLPPHPADGGQPSPGSPSHPAPSRQPARANHSKQLIALVAVAAAAIGVAFNFAGLWASDGHLTLATTGAHLLMTVGHVFVTIAGVVLFYEIWIRATFFREIQREIRRVLAETIGKAVAGALDHYMRRTQDLIRSLESVSARCHRLGIIAVFPTQEACVQEFGLKQLLKRCGKKGHVICLARTLLPLLKALDDEIYGLIIQGYHIQLAILDPRSPKNLLSLSHVERGELESTRDLLVEIQAKIVKDYGGNERKKPKGSLEVKFHRFYLPDSYLMCRGESEEFILWTPAFGKGKKRAFVLTPAPDSFFDDMTSRIKEYWIAAGEVQISTNQEQTVNRVDQMEAGKTSVDAS